MFPNLGGVRPYRPGAFWFAVLLAVIVWLGGCGAWSDEQRTQREDGLVEVLVLRVIDGDTMLIQMPDRTEERLRLIGVNTPEVSDPPEPYGAEAVAYAVGHLEGRTVFLETDVETRDRHGRLLGYLWTKNPDEWPAEENTIRAHLFNARLLLDGYAQLMTVPPNVKYVEFFRVFQQEAREEGRGLWSLPVDEEAYYIGNANTMRFHRPDCPAVASIAPHNRVHLETREAAFEAAYEPCRTCSP